MLLQRLKRWFRGYNASELELPIKPIHICYAQYISKHKYLMRLIGPSGFGGVLRHSNGKWIYGFAGTVGISTILHVELLAIYHGLKVAWDQGYRNIVCYSDSTLSIQLIGRDVNSWHHYASILTNIRDLVKRNWSIDFKHTKREANAVADLLAKAGAAGTNAWTEFREPPPAAIPLLQADAARVMFARI
ncbi:unnamed protein product [Trifolium pratense]|uniref:Uncharacterized protein n=1 Tax=Trifolium pratense TaxID=57577 RepID=A0ACB0IKG3_TRIPR|nr:unnamed protein product [Trifolium pratense]